jgi:major type 1 subunit fimbrin (pilin)
MNDNDLIKSISTQLSEVIMKRTSLVIALTVASSLTALHAQASDGTINFVGKVTAATCDISVDGGGADATVTLPTVSSKVLATPSSTAGRTNFNMSLTNCDFTSGSIFAFFEAGANVDPVSGRLMNSALVSAATNVDLQLLDSDGSVIKAGDASQLTDTNKIAVVDDGSGTTGMATLNYAVEYYATGVATAGDITSSVTYSLSYN